ncbi:MAG: hybrid sensor histidine kinase/response regulator [Deltaproteobacteria bacterium]|jgi:two-component system chemotaxis sensor kinase CheA|nr:MAG: hybrid sensor histidine kinase/response regulator [Deltaproteobacteria bacterium]
MVKNDNDFFKKLLATFKIEAHEHINAMSSGLIELEKYPAFDRQAQITETIFREAHSLKGAARSVSITEIEAICQSLESVFSALKSQELPVSVGLLDILHQAVDNLKTLLPSIERERTADEKSRVAATTKALQAILTGTTGDQGPVASGQGPDAREPTTDHRPLTSDYRPLPTDTVRISTSRLESLLLQTEELLSVKQATTHLVTELRGFNASLTEWEKEWNKFPPHVRMVRQSLEGKNCHDQDKTNSHLARLLEFLDWNESHFKSLESRFTALTKTAVQDSHVLGGVVNNLLQDMRKASILPLSSLLEIFPKFVRDLSRDQGKDAEMVIQGQEIEIDRRILEEMKVPLMHLVRNCIDHGIEKPEERKRREKSHRGTVTVAISQTKSSSIDISICDDGAGVDVAKVREVALRRGIISQEEAERLDKQASLALLYQSGISTSPIITDISGRGLGLAIVQEKAERLGGTVSVETEHGVGTTFRLSLPLTLATFRGIVVRAGESLFVLPTANVERVLSVNKEEIKTVENRETIQLDGQVLSLVRLTEVLDLSLQYPAADTTDTLPVVVLASTDKRLAFLVDEVVDEQEVLVKSLGKQLSRVRNIVGASVLATGKVVPVLNVSDLMKSAVKVSAAPVRITVAKKAAVELKSILVVEDSITARSLLKNILEATGYNVKTAVDGIDAFTALKTERFDLVVSDVDMPRMNGFDLTAKIRADRKLAELPVVLVTALDSREHRERGVEVGANAYIVKSSFNQSNLLEVIRRLI